MRVLEGIQHTRIQVRTLVMYPAHQSQGILSTHLQLSDVSVGKLFDKSDVSGVSVDAEMS